MRARPFLTCGMAVLDYIRQVGTATGTIGLLMGRYDIALKSLVLSSAEQFVTASSTEGNISSDEDGILHNR